MHRDSSGVSMRFFGSFIIELIDLLESLRPLASLQCPTLHHRDLRHAAINGKRRLEPRESTDERAVGKSAEYR